MVDWQFMVFCGKVGFVKICAFLVLIKKYISAIFITFCTSALGCKQCSVIAQGTECRELQGIARQRLQGLKGLKGLQDRARMARPVYNLLAVHPPLFCNTMNE